MSSARASFFHKSIGGYSAVKPRAIQELFDYQIAKNNKEVLDMLNIKYIIQVNEKGEQFPTFNPNANGNAWFVHSIQGVPSDDAVMKSLDTLKTKSVAVYNRNEFKPTTTRFVRDTTARVQLTAYRPNQLTYVSNSKHEGFVVFSEMYYKPGWQAKIDGKTVAYGKVNFALRGMVVPAGKHTITFTFEPQVVKTGSMVSLVSFILIVLLSIVGIYFDRRQQKEHSPS
jgi:hypothetical protein